jgi:hypothetical protein
MTHSDAIVRRQVLKAGLIVAGLPFCPEALFDRRAAAENEKPAEDTPIGPREIIKGLDGMSRVADKGNTFAGGHNAAAVISSAFFCREQKLDADTQKEILAYLDARLLKNPIYAAARPKEAADPKKLSENRRNTACMREVVSNRAVSECRLRSHDHGPPKSPSRAAGHHLGDPRRVVGADRADPQGILAQEAHRTPRRPVAEDAQCDPLPDAKRLPMGEAARAVRPQEHRPRLVPALGRGRDLREDLGGPGRGM